MRTYPILIASSALALSGAFACGQQPATAQVEKCEALAKLELPNAAITTAKAVAAGEFAGPRNPFSGADMSAFYKTLPAFCRIAGVFQR